MNNKVLVNFYLLELGINFDAFVPVNEVIWKIKKLASKSISDLVNIPDINSKDYILMDKDSGFVYNNNDIVINTTIRNGTELLVIPISNNNIK